MSEVNCFKCNSCGKLIEFARDAYKIILAGEEYYVGPGSADYNQNRIELHFCERCARGIKKSLEKIAGD